MEDVCGILLVTGVLHEVIIVRHCEKSGGRAKRYKIGV
jgi:hypothetical protein